MNRFVPIDKLIEKCYHEEKLDTDEFCDLFEYLLENNNSRYYRNGFYVVMKKKNVFVTCQNILDRLMSYDSCDYDKKIFKLACQLKFESLIRKFIKQKFKLTHECCYDVIMLNNLELFKLSIIITGCKFDTKLLEHACYYNSLDIIKYLLNNKLLPNKKCFQNLIIGNLEKHQYFTVPTLTKEKYESLTIAQKREMPMVYDTIYKYRDYFGRHHFKKMIGSNDYRTQVVSDCIDLLIQYNYKLTQEDIINCIKTHVKISNLDHINIKSSSEILDAYITYNFPISKKIIKNISSNINELINACQNSSLTIVRQLIKKGIIPTQECLRVACSRKTNLPMIRFLIEKHNLIPDEKCIKEIICLISNKQASYLLDKYVKKFEEKVEKKKLKVEDDSENISSIDSEVPQKIVPKKAPQKQVPKKVESDSDSESNSELEVPQKIVPKKVPHKKVSKVESDSDSESNSELEVPQKVVPKLKPKKAVPKKN